MESPFTYYEDEIKELKRKLELRHSYFMVIDELLKRYKGNPLQAVDEIEKIMKILLQEVK